MKHLHMESAWSLQGSEHSSLLFRILFLADSVQIRFLMCVASFGWALPLFTDAGFIERPYYAEMHAFAPAWVWGVGFLLHALGAAWRIRDRKERVAAALVINGLGFVVWALNCYSQIVGAGHWPPSATADLAATFMLGCAFASSGWNRSSTST